MYDKTGTFPRNVMNYDDTQPLFGNALDASRAVGLGLAPKEKIGD